MEPIKTNFELDNQTGRNHEGALANTPVQRLTATSIIGDKVENFDGEDLGQIKNLMVNINTGNIEYVVLDFGSFLGIGGKLFAIPFRALSLDPVRHTFLLNKDKESLKDAPGFDKDHWPETNHVYDEVNTYWGDFMGANTGGVPY